MSVTAPTHNGRITRNEIETKLRQIRGDVDTAGEAAKGAGAVVAGVAVVLIVAVAYFAGRKRGKRKSTVVEVRRF
ncbi:MAG: hypothetical protein ABR540_05115 [Acidimicrobiales bacterium]|nr:hypothetical protein [Actinomycetota bacterium]